MSVTCSKPSKHSETSPCQQNLCPSRSSPGVPHRGDASPAAGARCSAVCDCRIAPAARGYLWCLYHGLYSPLSWGFSFHQRYPQSSSILIFHYKPSSFGYPYLWKPPYLFICHLEGILINAYKGMSWSALGTAVVPRLPAGGYASDLPVPVKLAQALRCGSRLGCCTVLEFGPKEPG